jgi:hypothetical protein
MKLVKEHLSEGYKDGTGNSFGEKKCLALCKKYLPFLNVSYDVLEPRDNPDDPSFSQDEQYKKWDQLTVNTGLEDIDEIGLYLYILENFNDNLKESQNFERNSDDPLQSMGVGKITNIFIKFYCDTRAYTGHGQINDEYTSELDPVVISSFSKEDYESLIEDVRQVHGYDPKEYKAQKKRYAKWDKDMHDKSKWIKENNYKEKEGIYKGQWEWNWDEELGKWLNTQDRSIEMTKRGFELNFKTGKWVPRGEEPRSVFNDKKNKWEYKYPGDKDYPENDYI